MEGEEQQAVQDRVAAPPKVPDNNWAQTWLADQKIQNSLPLEQGRSSSDSIDLLFRIYSPVVSPVPQHDALQSEQIVNILFNLQQSKKKKKKNPRANEDTVHLPKSLLSTLFSFIFNDHFMFSPYFFFLYYYIHKGEEWTKLNCFLGFAELPGG